MKKLLLAAFVCTATVSLVSCRGQKKKVEAFADTFAGYVNSNQLDSIKSVYPAINFDSISHVSIDSISITEAGGNIYKVNYGGQKWIEVKVNEDGSLRVENSKGIAAFPGSKYEMALNSGMVSDTVPDVRVRELLNDEAYFDWLEEKGQNLVNVMVTGDTKKSIAGEGIYKLTTPITITNNSSLDLLPKDYLIKYTLIQIGYRGIQSQKGVAVKSGESVNTNIINYGTKIENPKIELTPNLRETINKDNTFTGNEYQEYINLKK